MRLKTLETISLDKSSLEALVLTNVSLAIIRIFDRNTNVRSVRKRLHCSSGNVDSPDRIGSNGGEPEVSVVGESTHDGWPKEGQRNWILRELLGLRVELGDLLAYELTDPDVSTGYDVDADGIGLDSWDGIAGHLLSAVAEERQDVGSCLSEP